MDIRGFVQGHCLRAVRWGNCSDLCSTVRRVQCGSKERLVGNGGEVARAPTAGQTRVAAAELHDHLAVSVVESLATDGHHIGHGVDLDRLKLVSDLPANIAEFD